ncbi:TonB-dependent receptor plug domain-containing protein [Pseudobacteriovorax antillogorgiicola]|uniref:Outer membrane receptor for ferrienterochelin and colicins n=1 Tax=Pseudobacteriovorax antillogorgiicola TaxID=1513793 RepID=A0A1Y6BUF4_9BACT|nr:TonB-dependent receptor [Pseudobacteriovorax antillogorgiicola]TCS54493.1 outer membrane receptor for ferrienterochelin and colicin [Pseudobacteriovorax antillogorgiicola]SMF19080.1 Outer membrane receptor for ferrienterochelin and colicins [Pseudobacteriovorax antillogorgiicola]
MKRHAMLILIVGSLVAPKLASSFEATQSLEKLFNLRIEVSSTSPDTLLNSPSSVSVIDRYTIQEYNFQSISEAIETLAGVSVNRSYFSHNLPAIRGILQDNFTNRVLILIDGVASWMSVTGHGELERININDLERIEVLKGPASVLYGTNAYSGAINLVLRRLPDENTEDVMGQLQTSISTNSHLKSANGHLLYADQDLTYFVSASAQLQEGFEYGEDSNFVDEVGSTRYHLDFQERSNFTSNVELKTSFGLHNLLINSYLNNYSFLGARPLISSGVGQYSRTEGDLINYNFTKSIGQSKLVATLSYDRQEREYSRIADDTVRGRIEGTRSFGKLLGTLSIVDSLSLDLGVEHELRKSLKFQIYNPTNKFVFNENNMKNRQVAETSLSAQFSFYMDRLATNWPLRFVLGVRQTSNEAFDSNLSMRATGVYTISKTSSLKFVYGQSYRAPSLFELYYEDSRSVNEIYGNEDLEPETSDSTELAYILSPSKNWFLQMTVFQAEFDNKIIRTRRLPNSSSDLSLGFVNSNKFSARGSELEIKYINSELIDVMASIQSIDGDDGDAVNNKYNFKFVPEVSSSVGLNKKFRRLSGSFTYHHIGKTEGMLESIPAQSTMNASFSIRGNSGTHTIKVQNLQNKQIEYPEYIRGNINSLYSGQGQDIMYDFSTIF